MSTAVAVAAGVLWLSSAIPATLPSEPLVWLVLLATFFAAEALQLHIEIRRQTFSVTLSELPFVLGLFALGPLGVLICRLVAAVVVMAFRRVQPLKAFFNFCLFAMECSVFAAIVVAIGYDSATNQTTWVAVWVAVLALDTISACLVLLAIGWTQSWPSRWQRVNMVMPVLIGGVLNASLGLIILIVLDTGSQGILLVGIVASALVVIYRSYAKSVHQHRTLAQVYDFAKEVEGSTVLANGGHLAAEAVREMLNAERAALWLHPTEGAPGRIAYADAEAGQDIYDGPADPADPLRERVLLEGGGVLFASRIVGAEQKALQQRGAAEVIGVPLSSASGVIGYMEVCDRRGDRLTFSAEDVRLMESLATHVSAASQNVQLLSELRYEASHDRMTGLPNRSQLAADIEEQLEATAGLTGEVGVLVVDLGTLQQVNETLGHDAGDELLSVLSALLIEHAPAEATVGRMGGDEFAVLMAVRDLDDAEAQALILRDAISVPCDVAGVTVEVNATIGLSVGPLQGTVAADLLQRADVALYAGHAAGRPVTSYQPEMDASSLRRLHLGTHLRDAMLGGQIFAVFQPLIAVGSNNVRSVETLLRWQHPRYGAVSPDDFIPLAERIGMINPLTMHVLHLALQQCRKWLDRDIRIGVAVNLSPRTLSDTTFVDSVALTLRDLGVPPELLTFEITEGSVMADPDTALPVLHALHGLGVKLSIDDFGTGYSSLAYLSRLPVDEVKIDKAFIQNMGTEINDSSITKAIIDLAHGLGLTVVAEGVEDELTRDLLTEMDCDTIQGYLVSRPLPGPRLDRWLAVRTATRPAEAAGGGRRVFITTRGPLIG
ncbi:MAG: bifunctional diguanylate cyclase/phosphodiesterase [Geodermatophilaceae bacterium]|nr:bifunctional diguanylate cyclase/phosphodiesterase [Geodermatophilaceae bacterium]